MKLLIIGGTGFLSSTLMEESLGAGHDVTIVTRGRRTQIVAPIVRQIIADRSDTTAFRAALQGQSYDAVLDAICFTPEQAQQDIDCFAGYVGRLVMISTDFVYSVGPHPVPIPEEALRDAPTEYGRNKAAAEDILLGAKDVLPSTALRPPHIVGPGGLLGTGSLQGRDPALPARLRRGEPIVLLDSGTLLIQPADRRDIAHACLAVLTAPHTIGKAYNIAGPKAVPTRRYYEILAQALGVPLAVASLPSDVYLRAFPNNASFARHRAYSLEALARDAAFRPDISLETSLQETLAWLDTNPPDGADAPLSPRDAEVLTLLKNCDTRVLEILASTSP
ncbi:MAG TPA: NAD-dependent epimerase/dehydratase family protein [Chthonomonadaceae bacterium]|nr:NAD-dependent epimerase/dehydratase family protein [Chthonomonadaceae bacterium]